MNLFDQLKNQTNRGKHWPMKILEALLLIVSGWRTWDFISQIMAGLPGVLVYALLTVVISEGAYLTWSKFAYPNADEGPQESVSIGMIALNTLGLLLLSFGENLTRATSGLPWAAMAAGFLSFVPWAMLAVNLIGALLFGVLDDEHIDQKTVKSQERLDRNAARDLKHAERMAHITAKQQAIESLEGESEALARELAPYYLKDITDRVRGQTITNLKRKVTQIEKQEQKNASETAPVKNNSSPTPQEEPFPVPAVGGGNGNGPKVTA